MAPSCGDGGINTQKRRTRSIYMSFAGWETGIVKNRDRTRLEIS